MKLRLIFSVLMLAATHLSAANIITNGTFGSGLLGWTVTNAGIGLGGEAEVLTGLGLQTPVSTGQLALLDSGPSSTLGSSTPTYGQLSQSFTLPITTTLSASFRYTLLTARFTGTLTTENDSFFARIIPAAAPFTSLLAADVQTAGFGLVPDAAGQVASPHNANFFEFVPSTLVSQNITLPAGTYTLAFRVTSDMNSLFDSGMLIENVVLDNGVTSAVPEPGSVLLAACGIVLGIAKFRRGKSASAR